MGVFSTSLLGELYNQPRFGSLQPATRGVGHMISGCSAGAAKFSTMVESNPLRAGRLPQGDQMQ
jgi:hypothetical protein